MLDMDTNFIIIIVIIITILLVWQVRTKCAYFLMLILYSLQHRMQLCWSRYTDCLSWALLQHWVTGLLKQLADVKCWTLCAICNGAVLSTVVSGARWQRVDIYSSFAGISFVIACVQVAVWWRSLARHIRGKMRAIFLHRLAQCVVLFDVACSHSFCARCSC